MSELIEPLHHGVPLEDTETSKRSWCFARPTYFFLPETSFQGLS